MNAQIFGNNQSFSAERARSDAHRTYILNPALRPQWKAGEKSTSAVVSGCARQRAIKRIFVTTNLERLRLGTSFLFHEIARIGKTRAGRKEEGRTTERGTKIERKREKDREMCRSRSVAGRR